MVFKTIVYTDARGELFFYDADLFLSEVSSRKEKQFELTLKEIGNAKTNSQLGYYFAVVNRLIYLALVESGYEITEAQTDKWNRSNSSVLKETIVIQGKGDDIVMEDSIIELSAAQKDTVSKFIDERIRFAAQKLQIWIPPPPDPGMPYNKISKSTEELKKYRR